MTLEEFYLKLKQNVSHLDNLSETNKIRLNTIIVRMEGLIKIHSSDVLDKNLNEITKKATFESQDFEKLEEYLNKIDKQTKNAIESGPNSSNSGETECVPNTKTEQKPQMGQSDKRTNNVNICICFSGNKKTVNKTVENTDKGKNEDAGEDSSRKVNRKAISISVGFISGMFFLAIGLIIAFFWFDKEKDTVYFIIESLKDIFGGLGIGTITSKGISKSVNQSISKVVSVLSFVLLGFSILLVIIFAVFVFFPLFSIRTYIYFELCFIALSFIGLCCVIFNNPDKNTNPGKDTIKE